MTDPMGRLTPVVRVAPAKLNLTLAIVGRRGDGFHDLHSVMVPLALADRLSFAPSGSERDSVSVAGFDAGPLEGNLVARAVVLARDAVAATQPPTQRIGMPRLSIRLEKRIPVAAGLAGGSSDAAAALDGALEAWGTSLDDDVRAAVAARLGSDVPFFLAGTPAVVEGRGERVKPLSEVAGTAPGVLLITPAVHVSTADAFAAYAAGVRAEGGASRPTSEHLAAEMQRGVRAFDLLARAAVLASANDLLPATLALVPGLLAFRRSLTRLLGRPIGQSGSGPTCWVLYPSLGDAEAAAIDVNAAIADGRLPGLGDGRPIVVATTFARARSILGDVRGVERAGRS